MFLTIPVAFAEDSSSMDDVALDEYNIGDYNTKHFSMAGSGVACSGMDGSYCACSNVNNLNIQNSTNEYNNMGNPIIENSNSYSFADGSNGVAINSNVKTADESDINTLDDEDALSGDFKISSHDSRIKSDSGNIIYINTTGTDGLSADGLQDNPYKSLGKAISVANDGDTIFIANGLYPCSNVVVDKNLTFIGESQDAILSGSDLNRICYIASNNVSFINLTFKNGYADENKRNGGAINSEIAGYLTIVNCSFINNRADTHGAAINVMANNLSKTGVKDIHVLIEGSSFINNTDLMYGAALHVSSTAYNSTLKQYENDVFVNISSSYFYNNYGQRNQAHTIYVGSSKSTYMNISSCVILVDDEYAVEYIKADDTSAYRSLVAFYQHSAGSGYADVNANWWGDNNNPNEFNRTNGAIYIDNWIVMNASVSKSFVVATLDSLKTVDDEYLEFDSSNLPKRLAIYSPSDSFYEAEVDMVGGLAVNEFIGDAPQDVSIRVDNQLLSVSVLGLAEDSWFIGENGYATLRDAVEAAHDGDIIQAVPNVYTPDVLSEEILIDKSLSITTLKDMGGDYVLLKSDSSRVFNVSSGVNLNLSNIIFENDCDLDGGLIYANPESSIEIQNSIFRKSKGGNGGAIYSKGDVKISNTVFENVQSSVNGGAIYMDGASLEIIDCEFNGVRSFGDGGVIYIESGNRLNISGSEFKDSHANNSGVIYSNAQSNNIEKSVFMENYVENDYRIIYANSSLYMKNSILVNKNQNDGFDVFVNDPASSNIDNNYWGTNSKVESTNVDLNKWVILSLEIDANLTLIEINSKHNLTVSFAELSDGTNTYPIEGIMPKFSFELQTLIGNLSSNSVSFDGVNNSAVIEYLASSNLGDEVISIKDYSDQSLSFYTRTTIYYVWFNGDAGYETLGEAVDAASAGDTIIGIRFNNYPNATIHIDKNLTIRSNSSQARAYLYGDILDSPVLDIAEGNTVRLVDLTFINAKSTAISNNANLTVENGVFLRNKGTDAGAILNNGDLNLLSSNFTLNGADGGAIYNNKTLNIRDSFFANNTGTLGGALFNTGDAILYNSSFIENTALENGGAIASVKNLNVKNSLFLKNKGLIGGAIYSNNEDASDNLFLKYSIFDGNSGTIGINVAASNMDLENNFWGRMDYANLIYNLSADESFEDNSDFKLNISGPGEVGYGESVNFTIELTSPSGDASNLREYKLNISSILGNKMGQNAFYLNQGKLILSYLANQEIGEDKIEINGLSGLVAQIKFNVGSLKTFFEFENRTVYYNSSESLEIYLKDEGENILPYHNVLVSFNGRTDNYTTDSRGKITIDLKGLGIGSFDGNLSFAGAFTYLPSDAKFKVDVLAIPLNIVAEDMETYYKNGSSMVILLKDMNGNILGEKLLNLVLKNKGSIISENNFTTGSDGKISFDIDYFPGNYTLDISYDSEGIYNKSFRSVKIQVDKMPVIIEAENLEVYYNSTEPLKFALTDNNGVGLANRPVSLAVMKDGSVVGEYNLSSNSEGLISKVLPLEMGRYTLKISFAGDGNYESGEKEIELNVTKMPSAFSFNTVVIHANEDYNLIAVLKGLSENPLAGKGIVLTVIEESSSKVKIYDLVSDDEGKVVQLLNFNKGAYSLNYLFAGDEFYKESELNITLNVLAPVNPYIEADDTIIKDGNGSVVIYLKDVNGEAIIAENILFEIGEESYTNMTDSRGMAVLYPSLPDGNYSVTISFANDELGSATKTISLKVLGSLIPNGTDDNGTAGGNGTNGTGDGSNTNGTGENGTGNNGADVPAKEVKTGYDLQKLIDNAAEGSTLDLGNVDYVNVSNVNITKSIAISGSNATVCGAGDSSPLFNILPLSSGGPESVNITGIVFKANNGDVLVLATADSSPDSNMIELAEININGITVEKANDGLVGDSVSILELNSQSPVIAPTNKIKISDNNLEPGVNPFKFNLTTIQSGSDVNIPNVTVGDRKATVLVYENMVTVAIDTKADGRIGKYFNVVLTDANGNPLADKLVKIGFNGKIYNRTTNASGGVKLQINLGYVGDYTFAVCFLGDDEYKASFNVAKITVNKQNAKLTTANKSYKVSAKTKTLTATFKTAKGNVITGKKISFTVNGKTYAATTNAKGVATVKVSLSKKGTYSFTVKYAGDRCYAAITAKGTLKLS